MANKKKSSSHPLAPFLPDFAAVQALSKRLGCSASHLVNIREGRRLPSLPLAKRIGQETGLSMEALAPDEG